jgi:hypothetical protein
MKRNILSIVIAILIVSLNPITSNALEPNEIVLCYLTALKNGDIQVIKDSIAGEIYNKSKVLLEQNKSYSEFLKKTYWKAKFQIKETTFDNNNVLVKVESKLEREKTKFILYLNKNAQGKWKIFKESAVP